MKENHHKLLWYMGKIDIVWHREWCTDHQICLFNWSLLCFQKEAVKIHGVSFIRAVGTTTSDVAINLNCSDTVPCTDIVLKYVNLKPANPHDNTTAYCSNTRGQSSSIVFPRVPCLYTLQRWSKPTQCSLPYPSADALRFPIIIKVVVVEHQGQSQCCSGHHRAV